MKPRYKRRILWGAVIFAAALVLAIVFVPTFVPLNYLKPKLESAISGKIGGDVNFSLLGGMHLVAHDVAIENGQIDRIMITVPMSGIFKLESVASLGKITVYGANLNIETLTPPDIQSAIEIHDSVVNFKGKAYNIIDGTLKSGALRGILRTSQHKYELDTFADTFHIRNHANKLDIRGRLYSDGSANGTLAIDTNDINSFFDFARPKIPGRVALTMDFDWDGDYGFRFSNILGDGFSGNIELYPNGDKTVNIKIGKLKISGGKILASGVAQNIDIKTPDWWCKLSGTAFEWRCDYIFGNMDFNRVAKALGGNGTIDFSFADIAGQVTVKDGLPETKYEFARGKTLQFANANLEFLPDFMQSAHGDFEFSDDGFVFSPDSGRWTIRLNKNTFLISGTNIKELFGNIDLRFIKDTGYMISGKYSGRTISDLEFDIAGQIFRGTATKGGITLHTDILNIDMLTSQDYVDNIEENQFLSPEPLTLAFALGADVSLAADTVIFNGDSFANFVFSKANNKMTFSITDASRGGFIATISADKNNYKIDLRLNQFRISGNLLDAYAPINISNAAMTGMATLSTFGKIAYDFWHNMSGDIDMTFDGGELVGIGTDEFFANAKNITTLNAETMIARAFSGGQSAIKKLRIVGKYDGGNFNTTKPLQLSLKHVDADGFLEINNGKMSADLNITLRGTAPMPAPISIKLSPDGMRDYSLTEIMTNFDADFLRDFTRTHDKF